MWMPLACQRTLSAASAAYSRFDRTLLAACQWPPRDVLNTFSSRRARRAEARSGTHLCAQGVARSRVHRCRRSMRPCVCSSRSLTHSGGGGRGRVSTPVGVLDASGAQDGRAQPRRWRAPPLRVRACTCRRGHGLAVGAEGAQERRLVRPQGWRQWRAALLRMRALFPARGTWARRAEP